jgi:hypothetical protein
MTYIPTETDWIIKSSQAIHELSEKLGFDIYGAKFWIGSFPSLTTVRGYVISNNGRYGPITINYSDLKKEQQ